MQSKLAPPRRAPELCAVLSTERRGTQGPFLLKQALGCTQGQDRFVHIALRGVTGKRVLQEECGILILVEAKGVHCEREGYSKVV